MPRLQAPRLSVSILFYGGSREGSVGQYPLAETIPVPVPKLTCQSKGGTDGTHLIGLRRRRILFVAPLAQTLFGAEGHSCTHCGVKHCPTTLGPSASPLIGLPVEQQRFKQNTSKTRLLFIYQADHLTIQVGKIVLTAPGQLSQYDTAPSPLGASPKSSTWPSCRRVNCERKARSHTIDC